jgi:DNA-binding MarR family transcriptional regulator
MRRMKAELVRAVQRWYPQIYLACHTRHQRAASTGVHLSAHDSSILAHLDEHDAMTAAALARHLNIGPPTLSATLNRLARLGYITRTRRDADRRTLELRLTKVGTRAMQASSVLDAARVKAVLAELTADELRRALDGLELLARAARQFSTRSMTGDTLTDEAGTPRSRARSSDRRTSHTTTTRTSSARHSRR